MKCGALIAGVLCAGMFVAEAATPPVTGGLFLHLDGSSAIVDSQRCVGTWTNLATGADVVGLSQYCTSITAAFAKEMNASSLVH